MRFCRAILIALMLMGGIAGFSPVAAQAEPEPVDIAMIPAGPEDIPEDGYLVEGGGFLDGAGQVIQFHDVDTLDLTGLQRSYMYRLMLVADRSDPGSTLLADQITLVHEFASTEAAADSTDELEAAWQEAGDAVEGDDDTPTYRVVVESADSLVSVISRENIVVEVMSTDFERRPDVTGHEAVVDATLDRLEATIDDPDVGLSGRAVRSGDMKVATFFDAPDSHQQYTVVDGSWVPLLVDSGQRLPEGLDRAFESQQVMTLNNRSQILVQVWLGEFGAESEARAYLEDPGSISPMFDEQEVAAAAIEGESGQPVSVQGTTPDGERASGWRAPVTDDSSVAGFVAILAAGDIVIPEEAVLRLVEAQEACLEHPDTVCPPLDLAEIIESDDRSPAADATNAPAEDGVFVSDDFPWRVDYGTAGWELRSVEPVEGIDYLDLINGRSLATIETVVDRHGDPQTCILENVRLLQEFEEHAVIDLGSDVEGERKAGKETGHAWAVYTVEPLAAERADQEYTIRYDCYTLVEGNASLVVTHTAPRDLWVEESAKGDDLRAEIEIDGAAAGAAVDVDVMVRTAMMLIVRIWIPLAA